MRGSMVSDRYMTLNSELMSSRIIRIFGAVPFDRCTSFDIALGCVLSYQDLARHDCRDAGGRAMQEQLPRSRERVLQGCT